MRKYGLLFHATILFLVSCAFSASSAFAVSPGSSVAELPPSSNTLLSRPDADKGPTEIQGGIWLIDIDSIDSSAQNFVANVYVTFRWKDPRLVHTDAEPKTYSIDEIWNPRIQIANEIGLVRRTFPEIIDVTPDGTATYAQRFVGPFSQPLNLNDFPFDTQTFRIHVVSAGNTPSEVEFKREEKWIEAGLAKAGGIAKDISLPDWQVEGFDTISEPYAIAPGIEGAGFVFDFVAKRDTWHYIWKVILPLLLIVMMSWSVFWIDPSNAGTQIAVATTSMLTLIAYRFAIDTQIPKVPYMTKMDQFIVVGTILVFLTLMQVLVTSRLAQIGREPLALGIDRVSRWVFPVVFVVGLSLALVI